MSVALGPESVKGPPASIGGRPAVFEVERLTDSEAGSRLVLRGSLELAQGVELWARLRGVVASHPSGEALNIDVSAVEVIDGAALAFLVHVRSELKRAHGACEFVGAPPKLQELVHLYGGEAELGRRRRRRPQSTLTQIGKATVAVFKEVQQVLAFLGQLVASSLSVVASPRSANWGEVAPVMERAGADALPVVLLINFLMGFIMAFQGAVQLQQFGANIFVADLVGLSLCRELSPLMTAIIVCGRSGAAFAAELGSMQVNEEVDALRTMGFRPLRFLVLPRVLGLLLVVPLLTILADAVGIAGGMVVGLFSLDVSPTAYINETQLALTPWDVFSGVIKSGAFALAIALIACQQGLATRGGAEAVGRRTTSAVVTTLFALILLDAAFTVLFHAFDL